MEPQPSNAVKLFISYAHKDEGLRKQLLTHLASLNREGLINGWYDRDINAGEEWHGEIVARLRESTIILLLVSPDFIESDYINEVEVKEAMERHKAGIARVIPIILRPADWKDARFGELQALPTDARPITSWTNRDKAFLDVVQGIRKAIGEMSVPSHGCKGIPNIPRKPLTGFVSRKDKNRAHDLVQHLKGMLAPGETRFIMLSGLEGVGKTKLAAEVARQLEADYQKCVIWSDAGERVDYTIQSLLDDIATQLGHSGLRTLAPDHKEERVRSLVASQPTLVVLDSYEKIAAEELGSIDEFLEHARCSVLYISLRAKVDSKTTNIRVPSMWHDESDDLIQSLAKLTQDPDVFTDIRIRRSIHDTVDGRPVLIEWVVQQIDAAPQEPDEVLKKIARGEGNVLQRVFNPSFQLLGKDGRATLLALSLFPSSATREALGSVVGLNEPRLTEAIRDLRTLMLIEIDTANKPLRFTTQHITRKLAEKLLSKDRRTSTKYWRNFVKHYQVQINKDDWVGDRLPDVPQARKSNIVRAMQFASYIGEWDTLMELYCKTKGYIHSSNVWRKAIDLAERQAEETLGDNENMSLPLIIEIQHEEIKEVRKFYEKLRKKSGKLGNKILKESERNPSRLLKKSELPVVVELSVVEFELGVFAYHQSNHEYVRQHYEKAKIHYEKAKKHYEKAKRYKELAKDQRGLATVCNNLGAAIAKENNEGCVAQAERELRQALKIFKEINSNFTKVGSRNLKWLRVEARGSKPNY